MIYVDDSTVKVGGVVLPGLFKSMEIKGEARVEEQNVQGKTAKPKQATGYEDYKVTLELILHDGPKLTKVEKLAVIQKLFQKPGQSKPIVHEIVNEHCATRGLSKVIFKNLITKEQSKNSELSVSIELWQYITMTITATKKKTVTAAKSSAVKLTPDYQSYVDAGNRGTAPKSNDKTSKTASGDNAQTGTYKNGVSKLPV